MGGALLQLVAYGSQDVYLIGNPQITLFKSVYKRHTNFALEVHDLSFKEKADFGKKISVGLVKISAGRVKISVGLVKSFWVIFGEKFRTNHELRSPRNPRCVTC